MEDTDVINFELALADITQIEKRLERLAKGRAKTKEEAASQEVRPLVRTYSLASMPHPNPSAGKQDLAAGVQLMSPCISAAPKIAAPWILVRPRECSSCWRHALLYLHLSLALLLFKSDLDQFALHTCMRNASQISLDQTLPSLPTRLRR